MWFRSRFRSRTDCRGSAIPPPPSAGLRAGRVCPTRRAARAVDLERLLASIFGNSPYLSELLLSEPAVLGRMLEVGPDAALDALLAEHAAEPPGNRAKLMGDLRRTKRRVAC